MTDSKPCWLNVRFEIASCHLEHAEHILLEHGALSVSIEDAKDQPLFEPLPGETPLWDSSRLSALYPGEKDAKQLQDSLTDALCPLNIGPIAIEPIKNRQWERVWMDQFKPTRFGKSLWVVPSHCEPPDLDAVNISLDPGLAFGTGSHATTMLCLQWLADHDLSQKSFIDYGCGSGILAVAAAKLGAQPVYAVDIDEQAILATHSNATLNTVDNLISVSAPDRIARQPCDILMANILSGTLIELKDTLTSLVLPGGKLILSGLLNQQTDEVIHAYETYFQFKKPYRQDEWALLEGVSRNPVKTGNSHSS